MDSPTVLAIHTSDRATFKQCRQLWDFRSPIRKHLEPVDEKPYFSFGRSIHKGLEEWYDPEWWDEYGLTTGRMLRRMDDAIAAFHWNESRAYRKRVDGMKFMNLGLTEEEEQEWVDRRKLGEGMLRHYMKYSEENDFGVWIPIAVEQKFEVELWPGVVYKGTIDLICKRVKDNTLWVWDHKTTASIDYGWHAPFEIDPQVGSYAWALWTMGYPIYGFLFNEMTKAVPEVPEPMKTRRKGLILSTNKTLATTPLMYREAIKKAGEPEEPYGPFLRYLENRDNAFFRRTEIERNKEELRILGHHVMNEAIDMTIDPDTGMVPAIYPNPTRDNCHGCAFRAPCLVAQEGGDVEYALYKTGQYREKRED